MTKKKEFLIAIMCVFFFVDDDIAALRFKCCQVDCLESTDFVLIERFSIRFMILLWLLYNVLLRFVLLYYCRLLLKYMAFM